MTNAAPCTVHGDWGGTSLRLFLLQAGQVIDHATGPGVFRLTDPAEAALRAALAPWRQAHTIESVLLCGMAGSRNGVAEVPYAECPSDLAHWAAARAVLTLDGLRLAIAPGLACNAPTGAPDVMRGEETQIFGALALRPALAAGRHLLVLPGTHSKWCTVEDGCVTGFATYLTGELFALLRDHASLTRADARPEGEAAGFADGLARARTTPLLGALFEARAAQLRQGRSGGWARGFLSGLLIGAELDAALAGQAPGRLTVIGGPELTTAYAGALAGRGFSADVLDGSACALAGLAALEAAWNRT